MRYPRAATARLRRRGLLATAALAAAGLAFAPLAGATPMAATQNLTVPLHVQLKVTLDWCDNTSSNITINGAAAVGSVVSRIHLTNGGGNHFADTDWSSSDLMVSPASGESSVFKGGPMGPGGNPWMWFGFTDDQGNLMQGTDLIPLGRCVQGAPATLIDQVINTKGSASLLVQALDCSNKGSYVNVTPSQTDQQVNGKIFFDNQRWLNATKHYQEMNASGAFTIKGGQVRKGNTDGLHGPGGNPKVYAQFQDAQGNPLPAIYLDRCVKLG